MDIQGNGIHIRALSVRKCYWVDRMWSSCCLDWDSYTLTQRYLQNIMTVRNRSNQTLTILALKERLMGVEVL